MLDHTVPEKKLKLFTKLVYYSEDIDKLIELVVESKGLWQGHKQIDFLNIWNEPVKKQYLCIYYAFEEIKMSILI